jgi:uncharacterized protein YkwD
MDTRFISRLPTAGSAIVILALALTLFGAGAANGEKLLAPKSACDGQASAAASPDAQEAAMRCLHKYARRKADRRGVRMNAALQSSAAAKANDLVTCGQFSHEACGRPFSYWFNATGYASGCSGFAENLGMSAGGSPRAVMSGWLDSGAHRSDLLERRYRHIGVALEGGYWVVHLGYRC